MLLPPCGAARQVAEQRGLALHRGLFGPFSRRVLLLLLARLLLLLLVLRLALLRGLLPACARARA